MDPVSITALIAAGAVPTYEFLYSRLSGLLDRRLAAAAAERDVIEVEGSASPVLAGELRSVKVNAKVLDDRRDELLRLAGELGSYDRSRHLISPENAEVVALLSSVRALLEDVYEQKITIVGEDRERAGTRIRQKVDEVNGRVIGHVGASPQEDLEIVQDARVVGPGGWLIGTQSPSKEV